MGDLTVEGSALRAWLDRMSDAADGARALQSLSDPAEKVRRCLALPAFDSLKLEPAAPAAKSLERAQAFKESGNRHFKEGRYAQARQDYTRSVRLCPVDHDNPEKNPDFAVFLANRSAALEAERQYAACERDIRMAFKYGYPRNLQYKIYHRLGRALLKQRQFASSKKAFSQCLDMIGKSDLNTKARDAFRAKIHKQMSVFNVKRAILDSDSARPDAAPSGEADRKLPPVSAKLRLEGGRLTARTDVPAGETLLAEKPFVTAVVNEDPNAEEDALPRVCPQTLAPLLSAVPCRMGSGHMFSSEAAREAAEATYLPREWRLRAPLEAAGASPVLLLALRLVTTLLPTDIRALKEEEAKEGESENLIKYRMLQAALETPSAKQQTQAALLAGMLLLKFRLVGHECAANISDGSAMSKEESCLAHALYLAILSSSTLSVAIFPPFQPPEKDAVFPKQGSSALEDEVSFYSRKPVAIGLFPALSHIRSETRAKGGDANSKNQTFVLFKNFTLAVVSGRLLPQDATVDLNRLRLPSRNVDQQKHENGTTNGDSSEEDWVHIRCANPDCKASFPLKENTKESLVCCPVEGCGKETNVYLKLKRMKELQQSTPPIRESLRRSETADDLKASLHRLRVLIGEWEALLARPYKDISLLDRHLRAAVKLLHAEEEAKWISEHGF